MRAQLDTPELNHLLRDLDRAEGDARFVKDMQAEVVLRTLVRVVRRLVEDRKG